MELKWGTAEREVKERHQWRKKLVAALSWMDRSNQRRGRRMPVDMSWNFNFKIYDILTLDAFEGGVTAIF